MKTTTNKQILEFLDRLEDDITNYKRKLSREMTKFDKEYYTAALKETEEALEIAKRMNN